MKSKHHTMQTRAIRVGLLPTIFAPALALAFTVPAQAATVPFTDDFSSGTANANGWYFYNSSTGGAAWGIASAPSEATLLDGNALRNNLGTQANTTALKPFESITLGAVGDSISVSLSFRAGGTSGTLYNLGFYNSTNDITANSMGGTNLSANSGGFTIYASLGANTKIQYRDQSGSAALFTSTETTGLGGTGDHTITFTLTMTSAGLEISSSIDGTPQGAWTDTSITATSGFTVNTLRLAANGSISYFDNIAVAATSIPEANAVWIGISAAGLTLGCLTRRRETRDVPEIHPQQAQ